MHYGIAGYFTKDLAPTGAALGGAVYYSGLQAARLGARVSIVSSADATLDLSALDDSIQVHLQPSSQTTTFENRYDPAGNRTQWVLAQAKSIMLDAEMSFDVLHLAPMLNEIAVVPPSIAEKVVLTPQGWLRHIEPSGRVRQKSWRDVDWPAAWAVVFSEEDVDGREEDEVAIASRYSLAVCTRGAAPATLWANGQRWDIPTVATMVVDPTGAGDVFAAAFFVHLYQTENPQEAVRVGHCAASKFLETRTIAQWPAILSCLQESTQGV